MKTHFISVTCSDELTRFLAGGGGGGQGGRGTLPNGCCFIYMHKINAILISNLIVGRKIIPCKRRVSCGSVFIYPHIVSCNIAQHSPATDTAPTQISLAFINTAIAGCRGPDGSRILFIAPGLRVITAAPSDMSLSHLR